MSLSFNLWVCSKTFSTKLGNLSITYFSLYLGLKIIQTVFLVLHKISSLEHYNSSSLISACIDRHDGASRIISSAYASEDDARLLKILNYHTPEFFRKYDFDLMSSLPVHCLIHLKLFKKVILRRVSHRAKLTTWQHYNVFPMTLMTVNIISAILKHFSMQYFGKYSVYSVRHERHRQSRVPHQSPDMSKVRKWCKIEAVLRLQDTARLMVPFLEFLQ